MAGVQHLRFVLRQAVHWSGRRVVEVLIGGEAEPERSEAQGWVVAAVAALTAAWL